MLTVRPANDGLLLIVNGGKGQRLAVRDWSKYDRHWAELARIAWELGAIESTKAKLYGWFPKPIEKLSRLLGEFASEGRNYSESRFGLTFKLNSAKDLESTPRRNIWLASLYLIYSTVAIEDLPEIRPRRKYLLFRDYSRGVYDNLPQYDSLIDILMPEANRAWYASSIHSCDELLERTLNAAGKASVAVSVAEDTGRKDNSE